MTSYEINPPTKWSDLDIQINHENYKIDKQIANIDKPLVNALTKYYNHIKNIGSVDADWLDIYSLLENYGMLIPNIKKNTDMRLLCMSGMQRALEHYCRTHAVYMNIKSPYITDSGSRYLYKLKKQFQKRAESKIEFLFNNYDIKLVDKLEYDDVSLYSTTDNNTADAITYLVNEAAKSIGLKRPHLLDGMACIGGNSISFSDKFRVTGNELDKERYEMLKNNTELLGKNKINVTNQNILEHPELKKTDILFLDPEWSGEDYKSHDKIQIKIGDRELLPFVVECLEHDNIKIIVLKLPNNADFKLSDLPINVHCEIFNMKLFGLGNMSIWILTKPIRVSLKSPTEQDFALLGENNTVSIIQTLGGLTQEGTLIMKISNNPSSQDISNIALLSNMFSKSYIWSANSPYFVGTGYFGFLDDIQKKLKDLSRDTQIYKETENGWEAIKSVFVSINDSQEMTLLEKMDKYILKNNIRVINKTN